MPTTLGCVETRAKRDTDPRTDAHTKRDAGASPAKQPNGQADPRTNIDTETGPQMLGLGWGHIVIGHVNSLPTGITWSARWDASARPGTTPQTYHRRRRQATLGRLTPIEYETLMTAPATQAA
jgi:hypothetical protein